MLKVLKSKRTVYILMCISLAVILSFQSFAAGFSGLEQEVTRVRENTSISPVIDKVLDLYVELSLYPLTREEAILAMLRQFILDYDQMAPLLADSLLRVFDPFGGYFPKTDIESIFGSAYRGYGILLDGKHLIDGHLYNTTIRRAFRGSPAAGAGFEIGDEFIEINGINVDGMGLVAVSNLLASIEDRADFVMRRGDREVRVSSNKDSVVPSALMLEFPFEGTALITIDNWSDSGAIYDFYMCMLYLEQEGYENLIIDLRGNRGGNVLVMAYILSMLVPEDGIVLYSVLGRDGELLESIVSGGAGWAFDKLVVLVDGESASATEVFTQSLRELAGALVIGSQTAGKGIGQFYIELESGDVAAITAFELVSSENYSYHLRGITPDINITPVINNIERGRLEQLNFVNSVNIRPGANNRAVLALNQRLARIGYIKPEHATSRMTDMTVTAVEIFQKFHGLPVGVSNIDHTFIDLLNGRAALAPRRYEQGDAVLDCAREYILRGRQAAEDFAAR